MMVTEAPAPPGDRVVNAQLGIDWSNWDSPTHLAYSQRAMRDFWPTAIIAAPPEPFPLNYAARCPDLEAMRIREPGTDRQLSFDQVLNRRLYNDALLVMVDGQVVHESYRNGMLASDRHVNHSTTKSLTTLLTGMAIADGLVDPCAPVTDYLDCFSDLPCWRKVTVQQALDMRTGLRYEEHYADPESICWSYFRATGYYPPLPDTPPGYVAWVRKHMTQAQCAPGEVFAYASPISNALGLIAASVYGESVPALLERKIFAQIGAEADAWLNLDPSGVAVTEGQLSLTLRDFGRWAHLFLAFGKNLQGAQVAPMDFIEDIGVPREELRIAWRRGEYYPYFPKGQYRNQTYVLDAEGNQLAMLGIHGQFCFIDRPRNLLVVGFGSYPCQVDAILVQAMLDLWQGIAECVTVN